jgi:hypothetical protein
LCGGTIDSAEEKSGRKFDIRNPSEFSLNSVTFDSSQVMLAHHIQVITGRTPIEMQLKKDKTMKIKKVGRTLVAIFLLTVTSTSIVWSVSEEVETGNKNAKADEEEVVECVKLPEPAIFWIAQKQACQQAVQAQEVEARQGQEDQTKREQGQVEIPVQDRSLYPIAGWAWIVREEMRRLRNLEKFRNWEEIQNPISENRE